MSSGVGNRMRELRAARKWSQADLAERVGVSLRTIGTWERTQTVPPEWTDKMAEVLGDVPADVPHDDALVLQYKGFTVHIHRNEGYSDEAVRAAIPAVLAALDEAAANGVVPEI